MPLQKRPGLVLKRIQNEIVILNPAGDRVHHLNETAAFIWEQWDGRRSSIDVAQLLSEKFETTQAQARQDVDQILRQFKELLLLVEADPAGS